jgi:hypothetical protein
VITNADIIDVCGRISEALKEPSHSWIVWFETVDLSGAASYTYRVGVTYCDTADQALREATSRLPRFIDPEVTRIRQASVVRDTEVNDYDGYHFSQTPQFQVR